MSNSQSWRQSFLTHLHMSPVRFIAFLLITIGLVLGVTVHKGFLIVMALGAFGPDVLRQFGVLNDLDEFQKKAVALAGLRTYLVGIIFLMVIVIAGGWHHLSLSDDLVPASIVVTMMLVVYYSSYCLSFWDARKAVSRILFACGFFWLAFIILSHGSEPGTFLIESAVVTGPFFLCAAVCRRWPRIAGVLLVSASIWSIYFFNTLPINELDQQKFFNRLFVFNLVSLPLAIGGVALLTSHHEDISEKGPGNEED